MTVENIGSTHLTATNIKHIKALFESGHTQAKINRSTWVVISGNSNNEYVLRQYVKDRGLGFIGDKLRGSMYEYKVKINKTTN